ncbi:MAG: hypothetical protein QGF59_09095 [Pirellulaceae bacterium]|nr:hypothetical protein [Pirellulaceae bacterium]
MAAPGKYLPDSMQGIERIEDLPPATIVKQHRNHRHARCPTCRHQSYRRRTMQRTLHDLGNPRSGRPRDLEMTYSQHYCSKCKNHFNVDMSDLATPGSHYTNRVVQTAIRLVVEDGLPYRSASWHLWREHRVFVPFATIQNWVEAGGKKGTRAA